MRALTMIWNFHASFSDNTSRHTLQFRQLVVTIDRDRQFQNFEIPVRGCLHISHLMDLFRYRPAAVINCKRQSDSFARRCVAFFSRHAAHKNQKILLNFAQGMD